MTLQEAHKKCTKCGVMRPLSEYHRCKKAKDGRRSDCLYCRNETNRAWRKKNPDKAKNGRVERNRAYRKKNPIKNKAHRNTAYAIERGRLTKQPCSVCGSTDFLQAHHNDYLKTLDVVWLCGKHHRQAHEANH